MPVSEKFLGRTGSTGKDAYAQITFFAEDYENADGAGGAVEAVLATAPSVYGGLIREKVSEFREVAHRTWEVTVQYATTDLTGETGQSSFSFKTSGGTQHITQAIKHVAGYAEGGPVSLLFAGAIGVSSSGVQGCDVVVPIYEFEETHYVPASTVNDAYKAILLKLTGTTNDIPFKGLEVGEGLFLGADGRKHGNEQWQITFYFAGSANRTNLTVGAITGIAKKGWEYLWVGYQEDVDTANKMSVQAPAFVSVDQVYYSASDPQVGVGYSWAQLGIGS